LARFPCRPITGGDWDMSIVFDDTLWTPAVAPAPPKPPVNVKTELTSLAVQLVKVIAELPA
jgi:hypothetical protein